MGGIHQTYKSNARAFIPGCSGSQALSILGRSDDDEILIFKFFKLCLPT